MMIKFRFLFLVILSFALLSCGASRSRVITKKDEDENEKNRKEIPTNQRVVSIVSHARQFEGTRYQYGGTTKKGMDCSGLIYVSFLQENVPMPRTSSDLARKGRKVCRKEVSRGDLLFFRTNKKKNSVNHVGLVVQVRNEDIFFIHASTSRGVIISSLAEHYWNNSFVMARRVL